MKKPERGITLISLVVIIIVLLILAGVALTMLTGENGIMTKAKTAREQHKTGQELEENRIAGMENVMGQYLANTASGSTTGGASSEGGTGGSTAEEGGSSGTTQDPEPVTYTVIYNSNGGTGTMESQTFTVGIAQNLRTNSIERNGYAFNGWNTQEDGSGTSYEDGVEINNENNLSTTNGAEVNLYAIWNIESYTITYEGLEEATLTTENPTSYTIETEDFTLNNPSKSGYIFSGWTGTGLTEATKTVTITNGSIGDRSYEANWSADPVKYPTGKTKETVEVGNDITIGTEKFKVIRKTSSVINAIPYYNITLSTTNPVQSNSAGTTTFSKSHYWGYNDSGSKITISMTHADNKINQYIVAYQTKLRNLGASEVIASILRYDSYVETLSKSSTDRQILNPGKTGGYFTGTANSGGYIYRIVSTGAASTSWDSDEEVTSGVRPMIAIRL